MGRVLVVDDDEAVRILMTNLLRLDGHEVVQAENGLEAQKLLDSAPGGKGPAVRPDLMLVDFEMSPMGGYDLVRWVRRNEDTREIPILMISGTSKDIQDLVEAEGVRFMSKLSVNDEILAAIRGLLKPAPQPAPPAKASTTAQPSPSKLPPAPILPLIGRASAPSPPPPPAPRALSSDPPAPRPMPSPSPRSFSASPPAPQVSPPPPSVPTPMTPAAAPEELIDDTLQRLIAQSGELASLIQMTEEQAAAKDAAPDPRASAPIRQLVDGILVDAISRQASDIHIETQKQGVFVRFRIDGVLHPVLRLPAGLKANIAARLKIMASLDISERRLPQDGRFGLRLSGGDQVVEFRTSTLPSQHGETIVLRILRRGKLDSRLEDIFLVPRDLDKVRGVLKSPAGLILVTGPTGGGKTTTLYTMIESLNTPGRNIITVEDPVEYEISGITQVPVKPHIGLTFEKVLRACLRQDPNVILVGEIRDSETAEIALKAAMTGHLVLSTLHTNYAPLAVYRLMNMGVKPFLITGALKLVVAQRLVRLLCPRCKVKGPPAAEDLSPLSSEERRRLVESWQPRGCEQCKGAGFTGRKPVIEVMPLESFEMRKLVLECANPDDISRQAAAEGMKPLRAGALDLVAQGLTSLSEAVGLCYLD